jgi:hypothetical protein
MSKGSREAILKSFEALKVEGCVSVTSLARAVSLTRSSIYKYYPDIVVLVRIYNSGIDVEPKRQEELKVHLLKKQLADRKHLVSVLTKACSELLVELEDARCDYEDGIKSKNLMISFLEKQLAEAKVVRLRPVK